MSSDAIRIFNPDSSAGIFAALSPAFPKQVLIGGSTFASPLNYIYGSVMNAPSLKRMILDSTDVLSLRTIVDDLRSVDAMDVAHKAFTKGNYFKFQIPAYRRQLMETGNAELVYKSGNPEFGVDDKGVGKNLMGKILMKLRDMATISEFKQVREDFSRDFVERVQGLLNTFQVMKTLISSGNDDLNRFLQVPPSQYNSLLGPVPESYSFDAVSRMLRSNSIPLQILLEIQTPGIMVHSLIDQYGNSFVKNSEKRIKKLLLNQSMEEVVFNTDKDKQVEILKKLGRNDEQINAELLKKSKEKAAEQLLAMPADIKDDLEVRLYILWKANLLKLPFDSSIDTMTERIDTSKRLFNEAMERFYNKRPHVYEGKPSYPVIAFIRERLVNPGSSILSDAEFLHMVGMDSRNLDEASKMHAVEAKQAELLQIIMQHWEEEEKKTTNVSIFEEFNEATRPVIIIEPLPQDNIPDYRFLSPECTEHMITIDGLQFPSVSHYYIACLIASVVSAKNSIAEIYKFIQLYPGRFIPLADLEKKLETEIESYFRKRLANSTTTALEARFANDSSLGALLLATGTRPIIYEDTTDSVLGVGPDMKGENIVGKTLMSIRENLAKSKSIAPVVLQIPTTKDMNALLKNNLVLRQWFDMRLKDAVDTSKKVASFLGTGLTPSIVDFVVNHMYANCASIYDMNTEVFNVPEEFVRAVQTYAAQPVPVSDSSVALLWRYMQYLNASFSEIILESTTDDATITRKVGEVLSGSVKPLRADFKCPGFFPSPVQNCTMIAVRALLDRIYSYVNRPTNPKTVPVDSRMAALIMSILTPIVPIDVKALSEENPQSLLVQRSIPSELPHDVANIFANYAALVDRELAGTGLTRNQMIIMSRITFFS